MNVLRNSAQLEIVQVERLLGVDGQGKPEYNSPIEILARVILQEEVVRGPSGESVRAIAMVYVDAQQSPLPQFEDRLATAQGLVGIVLMREDGRSLQNNVLDHVSLQLREE